MLKNKPPLSYFFSMQGIKLVLEDGSVFRGFSFGSKSPVSGEIVFNTGMVGYPESLTDPSYRGQILTLTYPLIGNYGVPDKDVVQGIRTNFESDRIQASGLIISDYSNNHNHWTSVKSLSSWLKEHNVPGIYGVDTRMLTKILREKGTMLGKIVFDASRDVKIEDPNKRNLVSEVSVKTKKLYKPMNHEQRNRQMNIILIDCGAKNNIIRSLLTRGVTVTMVPWDYNLFSDEFDGVMISNGPGDPKMCKKTIANIRKVLDMNIPTFGICMGNQLLALASGADTYKLKYGHRSQNQPCVEYGTKRCYITSQNHGFAVDTESLGEEWKPWFYNANDRTNEGIKHKSGIVSSCQFHPEATPGPVDTGFLFDRFLKIVENNKKEKTQ